MWKHCVYVHRKSDSGDVFYVGKATLRRGRWERPYSTSDRNLYWQHTVRKHGFYVEIFALCATDTESQRVERALIAEYGRARLVNLTDGGEGHSGFVASPELRRKRSINSRGKRSPAWTEAIRAARKGGGNGGVVKLGDCLPDSWRQAIRRGKLGSNNPMYGRTGASSVNRREVIDPSTGVTYPTIVLAASSCGLKMKTLYNMLSGHRTNRTALRFV